MAGPPSLAQFLFLFLLGWVVIRLWRSARFELIDLIGDAPYIWPWFQRREKRREKGKLVLIAQAPGGAVLAKEGKWRRRKLTCGSAVMLNSGMTAGRFWNNQLCLLDPFVSSQAFVIERRNGTYYLFDPYGRTRVNQRSVQQRAPLWSGVIIQAGSTYFRYEESIESVTHVEEM